jgi:hypothetical protein
MRSGLRSSIFSGALVKWAATAAVVVCACAASGGQATSSERNGQRVPPGALPWTLTLHVSGGFAAVERTLKVSSAGDVSAEDSKRREPATARATTAELATIRSFVVMEIAGSRDRSGECRDCFRYTLEIAAIGRLSMFELDDVTLAGSGIEPLVRLLITMLNRTLTEQARL